MDSGTKSMKVLSFLKKICRDQQEWVTRHSELTDGRMIDLTRHSSNGLLLP
jgi:hypothetical protein